MASISKAATILCHAGYVFGRCAPPLGKVAGPTNDTETFERIRSILRAPHSLTQFSSYEARVKAEIDLVIKERGFELDCLVDGVIVTKSREIFFWELVLGKYLFLQDARGRFCSLLPEP